MTNDHRRGIAGSAVLLFTGVLVMASACADDGPERTTPRIINPPDRFEFVPVDTTARPEGATEFTSADAWAGQASAENTEDQAGAAEPSDERADGDAERTVEEGDIYRVLAGSTILNLNAYRGLQVIDFSNVLSPRIVGRLEVAGSPVEMYVSGDRAFLLLNNWYGYYGSRFQQDLQRRQGGLALSVDISDRTNPQIIGRAHIPGYIQKSRLTREGNMAALYVVTGGWNQWFDDDSPEGVWESRTIVQSFDVSEGDLIRATEINLGGYVTDIQATPNAMLVARNNWEWHNGNSSITHLDISDPRGDVVVGDEIVVDGYVNNQFNMDLRDGILRVFSGSRWNNEPANYLSTWDASDPQNIEIADAARFGENEDLYATIFLADRSCAVTYRRIDPFHCFGIDPEGNIAVGGEFVVSGWNDFFRPVFDDQLLIGIGVEDTGGRSMAVSLYDVTNIENPEPMVARAEVSTDNSWSEASWDHRAFSVLENAVRVQGPNGELETGMVLLPFAGWTADGYSAAVQIFTFSPTSLTRRGVMDHGSYVRRSFSPDDDLVANLSENKLALHDSSDPDDPRALGQVELAPNYNDVFVFGEYVARVRNQSTYYYGWQGELPLAVVEILPGDEHADRARPVATVEIDASAQLYQSGNTLVAATMEAIDTAEWPYTYETTLRIHDLSDPTNPRLASELTTDRIQPSYYGYYYGDVDCFDCRGGGYYGGYGDDVQAFDGGLIFLSRTQEQELIGHEEVCTTYARENNTCWDGTTELDECVYYSGGISCRSLDGATPYCSGSISECSYSSDDVWACTPLDPEDIRTEEYCYDYERYRYWQRFTFDVLDLTDPDAPTLADTIDLGHDLEGVSFLTEGDTAYATVRVPVSVSGDSRPYVRYFVLPMGLSNPSSPNVGAAVNTPGELIAVDGDAIFTRDLIWGETVVETAIAKLTLHDRWAVLEGSRRFEDAVVDTVALDGAGHVVVSHRLAYQVASANGAQQILAEMTILDAETRGLNVLSQVEVDSWATLQSAEAGRALFQVPGGLLVFNVESASNPYAQAYFPTRGWPRDIIVEDTRALFAAGPYGVYDFDLDTFNLLLPVF